MANEKRLIDVNRVINEMQKCLDESLPDAHDSIAYFAFESIITALKQEPTVDAVEVVRCKDCKYQIKEWHSDNRMISKGYYTYGCDRNFHRYSSNAVNGMDNDFCSYGERR